jgi:hypothetical protein
MMPVGGTKYWYSDGANTAWDAMNAGKYRNWWTAWDSQNNQPVANSQSTNLPANNMDAIVFAGSVAPTTGPAAIINFTSVSDSLFSGYLSDGSITVNIKIKAGGTLTWGSGYGGTTWCGDATVAGTLNITGGSFGDYMGMNQAKFGANVTLTAGTILGATFAGPATFGGYVSLGMMYGGPGGMISVAGAVAVKDNAIVYGSLSTSTGGDVTFTESASVQGGGISAGSGAVHWKSTGQFNANSYSGVYASAFYAYKSVTITGMSAPMYPMSWDVVLTINAPGQYGMGGVSGAINLSKLSKGGGVMSLNGW